MQSDDVQYLFAILVDQVAGVRLVEVTERQQQVRILGHVRHLLLLFLLPVAAAVASTPPRVLVVTVAAAARTHRLLVVVLANHNNIIRRHNPIVTETNVDVHCRYLIEMSQMKTIQQDYKLLLLGQFWSPNRDILLKILSKSFDSTFLLGHILQPQ